MVARHPPIIPAYYGPPGVSQYGSNQRRGFGVSLNDVLLFLGLVWACFVTVYLVNRYTSSSKAIQPYLKASVLISYAYYEKDATQVGRQLHTPCGKNSLYPCGANNPCIWANSNDQCHPRQQYMHMTLTNPGTHQSHGAPPCLLPYDPGS